MLSALVTALTALALSLAAVQFDSVMDIEEATVDIRMRLRLKLLPTALRENTRDLVLLAIDEKTENELGRYGVGPWLAREPFMDQLRFLLTYGRPRVLAYDIILKEMAGHHGGYANAAQRQQMADALARTAQHRGGELSRDMLRSISVLVHSEANLMLTHMLAEIQEQQSFPVILGCNLRGGWDDPQDVRIPYWSETSSTPPHPLEYVAYLAIPEADIHFASSKASVIWKQGHAPNGSLPTRDFLDYSLPGILNIPRDADGVVRRAPLVFGIEDRTDAEASPRRFFIPSFALLSVLAYHGADQFPIPSGTIQVDFGNTITLNLKGKTIRIPIDERGQMRLNYRWSFKDFAALSFSSTAPFSETTSKESRMALAQAVSPAIRDRIAVVGVTTTGVDVGPTPVDPNIPLVYAQMTAINTILNNTFLHTLDHGQIAWLMTFCVIGFTALALAVRTVRVSVALVLSMTGYWIAAYGAMHYDLAILPVVLPTLFLLIAAFTLLTLRYFTESVERRKIRGMFSTMVSNRVLEWLEDHPESFSLEGHTTDVTVMFSDIADFTSLSERLEPARLIRLLNMYLTPITDAILEAGGYLDKYVGDGVMAVWGAPFYDAEHAYRACLSALEQQRLLHRLNDQIEAEFGIRLHVRMGINSGEVTAGNMGSERKFQYTVIGDVVNLASRIEPINRDLDSRILIGEATRALIGERLVTRALGRIVVVGREQSVTLYELVGAAPDVPASLRIQFEHYEKALAAYYRQDWDEAEQWIRTILAENDDGPSRWLMERVQKFRITPPPPGWNGEYWRMDKK